MADQTFAIGQRVAEIDFATIRAAVDSLPPPAKLLPGYLLAGSPGEAVEVVIAMAKRLGDLDVGESQLPRESDVLVAWRPSGAVAYLHPETVELFIAAVTFDGWMSREESRRD